MNIVCLGNMAESSVFTSLAFGPEHLCTRRVGFTCPRELQEAKAYACEVSDDKTAGDDSSWTSSKDDHKGKKKAWEEPK
jgi:hypothetical protein